MAPRLTALMAYRTTRLAAAFTAVALLAAWAPRHLHLTASSPEKGATVAEAPTSIRLWFNQPPELKLSRITVETARGDAVKIGKAVATDDPKSFAAPVEQALTAGVYTVKWVTGSPDGHAVRGTFVFTVPAEAVPAAVGR